MMTFKKCCLYDVQWQVMRVSLKGKFTTEQEIYINLRKLKKYIYTRPNDLTVSEMNVEFAMRTYRVARFLGPVFGALKQQKHHGLKDFEHVYDLIQRTNDFEIRYIEELSADKWDWNKVESDLKKLYQENGIVFSKLFWDTVDRIHAATKRADRVNGLTFQAERVKFFEILRNVNMMRNNKDV